MRILHIVKTSEGARWAALQVRELVRAGVEIDVALPSLDGRSMDLWNASGARLHAVDLSFPVTRPWLAGAVIRAARALVDRIRPDVIHSHFVSTTLTLRAAFGRHSPVPRLFQVPGPLHLEHGFYRGSEIASAGPADYWIASSRYTRDLYLRAGVPARRVFLSYYATENQPERRSVLTPDRAGVRALWGLPVDAVVVGNINMFYAPKFYLGQRTGLKAHEDVMQALAIVTSARPDVYGVLAGRPWTGAQPYFERLRRRAHIIAPGRIVLPGPLAAADVLSAWQEFDCAVHVPLSENCGGVVEPLLAGVPVIAGRVGGLPEVVIDGVTGRTVPIRDPRALADSILEVLTRPAHYRSLARAGKHLVESMFSAARTATEIKRIYEYILGQYGPGQSTERPQEFDSREFLRRVAVNAKSA